MNSQDCPMLFGFFDTYFVPDFTQYSYDIQPVTNEAIKTVASGAAANSKYMYKWMLTAPDATCSITETIIHMSTYKNKMKMVTDFSFTATELFDFAAYDEYCANSTSFEKLLNSSGSANPVESAIKNEHNSSSSSQDDDTYINITEHLLSDVTPNTSADNSSCDGSTSSTFSSSDSSSNTSKKNKKRGNEMAEKLQIISNIQRSAEEQLRTLSLSDKPVLVQVHGTVTLFVDDNMYITSMVMETKQCQVLVA